MHEEVCCAERTMDSIRQGGNGCETGACTNSLFVQRQTVVSQFFQLDKLVVEGGKTGKQTGDRNDIIRTNE